jgi:hypothetical protein
MTHITTHHQPAEPPATPRKEFTLNHLKLPAWPNLPRLLEQPEGRLVTGVGIRAPLCDPGEEVLAFGSAA